MPIFTSDLTSSGIIYADTITTNSNEDLTLNPAGTGAVVANARLKVNEISADDSTSVSIKSPLQLDSTLQVVGAINANGTGNSILVSDTLRIAQNGSGLRMTNVGAFDNDGSDNFRIFSTNDLIFSSNGESNTALTIDGTTQNVTINQDLGVTGTITSTGLTAGTIQISGNTITSTDSTQINFGGEQLTDVADPTQASDAATKSYVDTQVSGIESGVSAGFAIAMSIAL